MSTIFSKLNIKVGVTLAIASFGVFLLAGAVIPGKTDHTKAEDCSPVYSQPIFNPYPITWSNEAGYDCTDFATLAGGVHGSGAWTNDVQANVGDTVTLRVYVHNGAATNSQQVMHGVQYNVNLDTSAGSSHTITAQLTASNAAEKDGSIVINTPAGSSLQLVSGDLQHYIGDQQPCFDFAQLFYITVKVVGPTVVTPPPQQTPSGTISGNVGGKIGSQCLFDGTVTWSTQNVGSAEVDVVNPDTNQQANFATGVSGSSDAPWIQPSKNYVFNLYDTDNGQKLLLAHTALFTNQSCGTTPPPPVNSAVTLSISSFCVGQAPLYNVQGSSDLAGQQIVWSSTKNGASTGEVNDNYGQTLNGNASWNNPGGVWSASDVGSWTKTVSILKNGQIAATSQPFAFTVSNCGGTPPPPINSTVTLSISNFCVGQTPTYTVQGSSDLSGQQIYWSSTLNGTSTGENNANYGQTLNSSALWSGPANGAWTVSDIGSWTKTVGVLKNGQAAATSQPFAFTVSNCGTAPASLSCSANVASANVGDNVTFSAIGGNGSYVWGTSNNANAGSGSAFNVFFQSAGNKQVSVTSGGQTANCAVLINAPASTGNCNNDSNSCNTNTNNNTQTGSGTNSSNQNNNTNVNGDNNTITNSNENCVNNSCNNTSTNNYTTTTYTPPVYPVYNYTQPAPVYNYTPPPVYVASNDYVPAVLGGNVNLTYSKSAFNNTKNANATSVTASKEDRITYTLTVTNSGNTADNNFVVTDDLSQVLPYADVVDNGGGYLSGNTISFPAVTVPADGSVQESFQVVVKFSLSDNLTYTMVNTYGNTVTININHPQVLGAFTAPTTGADTNAFVFAGLLTSGFALFMKRKSLTKLIFS